MRKLLLIFLCVPLLIHAQDFPERPTPPRLVNDFADLLEQAEEQQLEQKLVAYNDSTSTQIAVVTLTSIGQYDAASYSFELANRWGIGRKSKNNGILILVVKESRDVFIATGYGTEEFVPDAIAKRITEQIIVPEFKQGNFYAGLDEGTDALFGRLTGQFKGDETGGGKRKKGNLIPFIIIIIIIIIIISRRRGGGGGWGGRGRSILFGPGMGWGGFSSGGFSSGRGSFGGGGFGGFGGGSFGGGGAGGKW